MTTANKKTATKLAIILSVPFTGAGLFIAITHYGPVAAIIAGAVFFVASWCAIDAVLEGV